RVEAVDPLVHAFVTLDAEGARAAARSAEAAVMAGAELGPLHGLPVSVKDLEPVAGVRLTFGSRFYEDHVPAEDGVVASRLRAAGRTGRCRTCGAPAPTRGRWRARCATRRCCSARCRGPTRATRCRSMRRPRTTWPRARAAYAVYASRGAPTSGTRRWTPRYG